MKKALLFIGILAFSMSNFFGQHIVQYFGNVVNYSSTAIKVKVKINGTILDSTLSNASTGSYSDSLNMTVLPTLVEVSLIDCNGTFQSLTGTPRLTAIGTYVVTFSSLDYCPTSACIASFTKHQAINPITRLPIPNQAVIVNTSTGSGLSYSWNFGDGSPPVSGLFVTHTYATHGSYNVCLTISNSTTGCNNTFCDTLTVDSAGNVRSSFTVTTGNSISGIEENSKVSNLQIYPNPTADIINLDFSASESFIIAVRILDIGGKEVYSSSKSNNSGSNLIKISTSNFEEGMYIIQLNDGVKVINKRVQVIK